MKRAKLGFKIILPMFAIAGLSMGNQSCETTKERNLKMNIELGSLSGRVITLPNGETIDFPYVANALFYRQVINHDHYAIMNPIPTTSTLVSSNGTFKTQSTKVSGTSAAADDGLVSQKDVELLEKFGYMSQVQKEASLVAAGMKSMTEVMQGKNQNSIAKAGDSADSMPACLYDLPQGRLGGEIISFQATWGVGLGLGYGTGGELTGKAGGTIDFSQSKLELGLRLDDPLSQQVVAIGDGVTHQSNVKFGFNFAAGIPVGLNFFYTTPITDVIREGMTEALDQMVKKVSGTKTWHETWESRVIYDPDLADNDNIVLIRAGSRNDIVVDDTFSIYNMHYAWAGAPCTSLLKYKIPTSATPIASIKIIQVGDNVSAGQVTYLQEGRILPGDQVKVLKLNVPETKKKP